MNSIITEGFFLIKKGNAQEAFELKSFTIEAPSAGELIIEVEAFGLNYADVMARNGLYREAPPMPCVLGYEVVGKVRVCGPETNPELLDKRVLAFCRFGGYAKHAKVSGQAVVEVGEESAGELLALATQGVTAFYMAEYICPIRRNDRVLIHAAAGGVGTLLVQLAKRRGAIVYAKVSSEEKEEYVRKLGADFTVNYRKSDYAEQMERLLHEEKLDICFNPVGGSTFKKDMHLLGAGGRNVLFGGSELSAGKWGFFSKLNFVRKMGLVLPIGLMMQSKNIIGVNMLKIGDHKPDVLESCLKGIVDLYKKGELKVISGGMYQTDEIHKAHAFLEGGESSGKISVFWK